MKLREYIDKHHKGSIKAFAEYNGVARQQIQTCLKRGYYYVIEVEGKLMLAMAKKEVKRNGGDDE